MRFWFLLFGVVGFVAACGDGDVGDDCDENDDCEEGLFCDFDDPAAQPNEGICRRILDTDDT